jgi:hypothetical protein
MASLLWDCHPKALLIIKREVDIIMNQNIWRVMMVGGELLTYYLSVGVFFHLCKTFKGFFSLLCLKAPPYTIEGPFH